jgi:predicted secreted Zn-dependent protease
MSILQLRASRLLILVLFVLGATASIAPSIATAAATERVSTATYRVYGATANAIRASLDARRPGNYDARTQWFVDWSYTSAVRSGRCVVASSKVHTRINFTYPRWTAPASATDELRADWSRYLSRLRVHESGHATNGRTTATRIVATLRTTRSTTCSGLDRALHAAITRHFAAGNALDRAYDRRTQHGATQGAVFPAT